MPSETTNSDPRPPAGSYAAREGTSGDALEPSSSPPDRSWGRAVAWRRLSSLRLPHGVSEAVWLFVLLRMTFSVFGWVLTYLSTTPPPCWNHEVATVWVTKPRFLHEGLQYRLLGIWQQWDGCWYEKIATFGYEPGLSGTAFYPLYPALIHLSGRLLGGNLTLGALAISGIAYIAAMVGLYRLVAGDFPAAVAQRTLLYISIFPASFFFFAPFTESLFLACAVWSIYAARTQRWLLAGVCALLAGFTRSQGILLALPLGWEVVRTWRAEMTAGGSVRPHDWRNWLERLTLLIVPAAPAVAMLVYVRYAIQTAGISPFAAQAWWGSTYHAPWTVMRHALDWTIARGDAVEGMNLASTLIILLALLAGVRLLPFTYTLYALPQFLLVAMRLNPTPMTSTTRYMVLIFPAFVVLAVAGGWRRFDVTWVVSSTLFLGLLLYTYFMVTFVA